MFTSFRKRQLLHHRKHHRKSGATRAASTATKIILSDAIIDITIIETKTNAALEAANEHLTTSATLVVIKCDLLMCCHMRNEPLRQLKTNLHGN